MLVSMEYVILVAFLIYLAPWMLAEGVGHPRAKGILWLNLVLGWTVVNMKRDWNMIFTE